MKPIWKWIIGVVVFLLLAVAIGSWYLSRNWKPILDEQLKTAIINASDSLYQISYDDISLNLITGNASLINFELIPDSSVYRRLHERKEAPDNIFHIQVDRLRIRNVGVRRIVTQSKLNVGDIIFDNPNVHITNEYQVYNDTVSTSADKTLYESISNTFKEVSIQNMLFNNVNLKFTKVTDSANPAVTELTNINLRIHDLLIDSLSEMDTTRFFHTREIELDMPGTRYNLPDSLYYASFDHLTVSTSANNLLITGLKYAPRMSKGDFRKKVNQAKDMFVISFDTIRMEHIDLTRFVRNQRIEAGELYLDKGVLDISNDLTYRRIPKNHIGRAPHQQLMQLNQNIKIDSVMVSNVDISYAEVGSNTGREGKITFQRTGGKLYNVTNDSLALLQNKTMVWDMTTYMMNTGKISAVFNFDMLSKNGAHSYRGTLGPMNGTSLNRILTPLLNVEVASANIKGVSFNVDATDHRARGQLKFDYNNLKANILESPDEDGKRSSKSIISFLANSFIINDSNPDANGVYHTGTINYARQVEHSFFKHLWQSLLDGIKPTVGIGKERERKMMNSVESVKGTVEKTGNFLKGIFKKREKEENEEE